MTAEKIAHFKSLLLAEREKVAADRASYASENLGGTPEDEAGELSDNDPNDPGDEGANLFDRDRNMAAVENSDRILAKIDRALAKIEEGTYGLSDIDGAPMPEARLEVVPYAVTTIDQEEAY
jgi:DnaK suppressor protein